MATPEDAKTSQVPLSELGGTGLRNTHGNIDEEVIRDLQWPNCIQVYKQMESDALISGALYAIKQFIKSAEWKVEEYNGPDKPADAKEQAEFLRTCLDDMEKSWGDVLEDILSFLTYGFSVHELVYKKRLGMNPPSRKQYRSKFNDGKIGWAKIPIRSQDSIGEFKTSPRGDLIAVHQKDYWNKIDVWIPADRFLLFRTSSYKDNPYGRSVLNGAYRAYYFRRNLEIFESIGIERNLSGIPIIRVPSEILSIDADENSKKLRAMYETMGSMLKKNDQSYVMLPSDIYGNGDAATGNYIYDIELLKSDGTNLGSISPIVERWDRRILQSCLADVMLIGGQSVGSYSLASTKADMFRTAIESYLDTIADRFNQHAIPVLFEYNGWDSAKVPKLKHTGIDRMNLEPLATLLDKAGKVGMLTPDDNIENYLRDLIGVDPIQQEGECSVMERARRQAEMQAEQSGQSGSEPDEEPPINFVPEV